MDNYYKSALDKIKLNESEKNKAKALFFKERGTRKESGKHTGGLLKTAAVAAAALALILTANAVYAHFGGSKEPMSGAGENYDQFTITAYAKELTKTEQVYADKVESGTGGMSGNSEEISFSFWFPFECRGKNIDTITYTIQNGAFQVTAPAGRSPVIDGEEVADPIDASVSFRTISESLEAFDTRQYRSFSVSYEEQSNEETSIEVVDSSAHWEPEKVRQYQAFGFTVGDQKKTELEKEVCDFLTKDLGITCTATFGDGTVQTKKIAVSNKIVMMSKLHDLPDQDEDWGVVVRCFSLQ